MTTRIDHTNCSHDATPKARQMCRDARRVAIRDCQTAYFAVDADELDIHEYYAMVELLSYQLGVTLDEAYNVVENGPVVH